MEKGSELEAWLAEVRSRMGPEFRGLLRDFVSKNKVTVWEFISDRQGCDWKTSLGGITRETSAASAGEATAAGLWLEPDHFSSSPDTGWRRGEGVLGEVAVCFHADAVDDDAQPSKAADIAAALRPEDLPDERRDNLLYDYPNLESRTADGRPRLAQNRKVYMVGKNEEQPVDERTSIWVSAAVSFGSDLSECLALSPDEAARRINEVMPEFRNAAEFVRGYLAPRSGTLNRETLLGWCGEYAVSGSFDKDDWVAEGPRDFVKGRDTFEVKSQETDLPAASTFTLNEIKLGLANPEAYHLVRVAVDSEAFRELLRLLRRHGSKDGPKPSTRWQRMLLKATGCNVRALGDGELKIAKRLLGRIKKRSEIESVAAPFTRSPLNSLAPLLGSLALSGKLELNIGTIDGWVTGV